MPRSCESYADAKRDQHHLLSARDLHDVGVHLCGRVVAMDQELGVMIDVLIDFKFYVIMFYRDEHDKVSSMCANINGEGMFTHGEFALDNKRSEIVQL